VASSASRTRL